MKTYYWVGFDKNGVKTPVCFSEPSAYCCGSHATQKNKLAINRDKPLELAN